jgi:hypothetical protein
MVASGVLAGAAGGKELNMPGYKNVLDAIPRMRIDAASD